MNPFDPEKLRLQRPVTGKNLTCIKRRPPRHKQGEKFLMGPIPLTWLAKAAAIPGKALTLGIALWFEAGCENSATIKASGGLFAKLYVGRNASYRGLRKLEKAGLVEVERHQGRNPVVTIIQADKSVDS